MREFTAMSTATQRSPYSQQSACRQTNDGDDEWDAEDSETRDSAEWGARRAPEKCRVVGQAPQVASTLSTGALTSHSPPLHKPLICAFQLAPKSGTTLSGGESPVKQNRS